MNIETWNLQNEINKAVRVEIESREQRIAGWPHLFLHKSNTPQELAALQALGPNPTAEEFRSAIDVTSGYQFDAPTCAECKQPAPAMVYLENDCEECGGSSICPACLGKALTLVEASL